MVANNSIKVKDLEKGKKYKFRVKAENAFGVSEPIETDKAILAKDPYGKINTGGSLNLDIPIA